MISAAEKIASSSSQQPTHESESHPPLDREESAPFKPVFDKIKSSVQDHPSTHHAVDAEEDGAHHVADVVDASTHHDKDSVKNATSKTSSMDAANTSKTSCKGADVVKTGIQNLQDAQKRGSEIGPQGDRQKSEKSRSDAKKDHAKNAKSVALATKGGSVVTAGLKTLEDTKRKGSEMKPQEDKQKLKADVPEENARNQKNIAPAFKGGSVVTEGIHTLQDTQRQSSAIKPLKDKGGQKGSDLKEEVERKPEDEQQGSKDRPAMLNPDSETKAKTREPIGTLSDYSARVLSTSPSDLEAALRSAQPDTRARLEQCIQQMSQKTQDIGKNARPRNGAEVIKAGLQTLQDRAIKATDMKPKDGNVANKQTLQDIANKVNTIKMTSKGADVVKAGILNLQDKAAATWTCSKCGATTRGKFCGNCGEKRHNIRQDAKISSTSKASQPVDEVLRIRSDDPGSELLLPLEASDVQKDAASTALESKLSSGLQKSLQEGSFEAALHQAKLEEKLEQNLSRAVADGSFKSTLEEVGVVKKDEASAIQKRDTGEGVADYLHAADMDEKDVPDVMKVRIISAKDLHLPGGCFGHLGCGEHNFYCAIRPQLGKWKKSIRTPAKKRAQHSQSIVWDTVLELPPLGSGDSLKFRIESEDGFEYLGDAVLDKMLLNNGFRGCIPLQKAGDDATLHLELIVGATPTPLNEASDKVSVSIISLSNMKKTYKDAVCICHVLDSGLSVQTRKRPSIRGREMVWLEHDLKLRRDAVEGQPLHFDIYANNHSRQSLAHFQLPFESDNEVHCWHLGGFEGILYEDCAGTQNKKADPNLPALKVTVTIPQKKCETMATKQSALFPQDPTEIPDSALEEAMSLIHNEKMPLLGYDELPQAPMESPKKTKLEEKLEQNLSRAVADGSFESVLNEVGVVKKDEETPKRIGIMGTSGNLSPHHAPAETLTKSFSMESLGPEPPMAPVETPKSPLKRSMGTPKALHVSDMRPADVDLLQQVGELQKKLEESEKQKRAQVEELRRVHEANGYSPVKPITMAGSSGYGRSVRNNGYKRSKPPDILGMLFLKHDKDHNGRLDPREMKACLHEVFGQAATQDVVQEALKEFPNGLSRLTPSGNLCKDFYYLFERVDKLVHTGRPPSS